MDLRTEQRGQVKCGGSLIHRDIVLGVAHCGDLGLNRAFATVNHTNSNRPTGFEFTSEVESYVWHEDWHAPTRENDIMLFKLKDPVPERFYNARTASYGIALNTQRPVPNDGTDVTVVGVGQLSAEGSVSKELRDVTVQIIDYETCDSPRAFDGAIFDNQMICAGVPAGGKVRNTHIHDTTQNV